MCTLTNPDSLLMTFVLLTAIYSITPDCHQHTVDDSSTHVLTIDISLFTLCKIITAILLSTVIFFLSVFRLQVVSTLYR